MASAPWSSPTASSPARSFGSGCATITAAHSSPSPSHNRTPEPALVLVYEASDDAVAARFTLSLGLLGHPRADHDHEGIPRGGLPRDHSLARLTAAGPGGSTGGPGPALGVSLPLASRTRPVTTRRIRVRTTSSLAW